MKAKAKAATEMNMDMDLDLEVCDRARLARDAAFDGRFFIAVLTTGIYCRPICPSRTARRENVRFYRTGPEAVSAGFRACLRCRPETVPGTPAWSGSSSTVRRALRLIQDGALREESLGELAERLGVSPRHLGRLFQKHVGASPQTVALAWRLREAHRLICETDSPMSRIAAAAGYGSVRRFNDAILRHYGRSPSDIRRSPRLPGAPSPSAQGRSGNSHPVEVSFEMLARGV